VRDVDAIRLPQWGRVVEADGVVPYEVQGAGGEPIEQIRRHLRDFVAQGRRAGCVRSYAYACWIAREQGLLVVSPNKITPWPLSGLPRRCPVTPVSSGN
jgi:hypothetical protein